MREIVRYQFEGGVNPETWRKFRIGCIKRGVTIKERLCELINQAVIEQEQENDEEE